MWECFGRLLQAEQNADGTQNCTACTQLNSPVWQMPERMSLTMTCRYCFGDVEHLRLWNWHILGIAFICLTFSAEHCACVNEHPLWAGWCVAAAVCCGWLCCEVSVWKRSHQKTVLCTIWHQPLLKCHMNSVCSPNMFLQQQYMVVSGIITDDDLRFQFLSNVNSEILLSGKS